MSDQSCKNQENIASLRQNVLRHLSHNSNISQLSRNFGALQTNMERVDFVLDLLKEINFIVPFLKDSKNNKTSETLRQRGNEMFKIKQLQEAWELYTRSIAFAEHQSTTLALAYANRSAVLFEINDYAGCQDDISRALENNYPENLRQKLYARQKNLENIDDASGGQNWHESIPSIKTLNPKIECASNSIEIRCSDDLGRHIVAVKDIDPGEILAVEKPYAQILVNGELNHCHECLQLCYSLISCDCCTKAFYCSLTCKKKAFDGYHRFECNILATTKLWELDKLKMLPLKIALMLRNEDDVTDFQLNENEIYYSNRYKEIHNLITNCEMRSVSDLFERALTSAIIYKLVLNHTTFFDNCDANLGNRFKEVFLLHMQTGPSNFHEITELAPNSKGFFEPTEVSSGAFAFLSLLNHSCDPNVTRFCYGSTIVLRAIKSIKKEEQCFDNYGYHHALLSREERQKYLKSQYFFNCICQACVENWDVYANLPTIEDKTRVDDDMLLKLSAADRETAHVVLQDMLHRLQCLEKFIPSKNFCQIQEAVKQCFATLGNRRSVFHALKC